VLPSCAQLLQDACTLQLVLFELLGMLWVAVEELLMLTVLKVVVLLLWLLAWHMCPLYSTEHTTVSASLLCTHPFARPPLLMLQVSTGPFI
jgi:hypothetical protein